MAECLLVSGSSAIRTWIAKPSPSPTYHPSSCPHVLAAATRPLSDGPNHRADRRPVTAMTTCAATRLAPTPPTTLAGPIRRARGCGRRPRGDKRVRTWSAAFGERFTSGLPVLLLAVALPRLFTARLSARVATALSNWVRPCQTKCSSSISISNAGWDEFSNSVAPSNSNASAPSTSIFTTLTRGQHSLGTTSSNRRTSTCSVMPSPGSAGANEERPPSPGITVNSTIPDSSPKAYGSTTTLDSLATSRLRCSASRVELAGSTAYTVPAPPPHAAMVNKPTLAPQSITTLPGHTSEANKSKSVSVSPYR